MNEAGFSPFEKTITTKLIRHLVVPVITLLFNYGYAVNNDKYVINCPAISECKPSDGPKKNLAYAKINQEAYECFQQMGQSELANKAFTTKTKCQAIYGSSTATIGSDNEAVSTFSNKR